MKLDEYQKFTNITAKFKYAKGKKILAPDLVYPVLGLNGEAGEVAEKVKKLIRDKKGVVSKEDRRAVALELGDVLWYLAQSALRINMKLSEVAKLNIQKLESRRARDKIQGSGDNR